MRFPVIRIKEGNREHIVGSDTHDHLYVDQESGGIHYLSRQSMYGTRYQYESDMHFVGKVPDKDSLLMHEEIEMVDILELVKMATESVRYRITVRKELEEALAEFFEKEEEYEALLRGEGIENGESNE